jgi:hypothetical protein
MTSYLRKAVGPNGLASGEGGGGVRGRALGTLGYRAMATALIKFTGLTAALYVSLTTFSTFSAQVSREKFAEMERARELDAAYRAGRATMDKQLAEAVAAEAADTSG